MLKSSYIDNISSGQHLSSNTQHGLHGGNAVRRQLIITSLRWRILLPHMFTGKFNNGFNDFVWAYSIANTIFPANISVSMYMVRMWHSKYTTVLALCSNSFQINIQLHCGFRSAWRTIFVCVIYLFLFFSATNWHSLQNNNISIFSCYYFALIKYLLLFSLLLPIGFVFVLHVFALLNEPGIDCILWIIVIII